MLNSQDQSQLNAKGISEDQIMHQLSQFEKGFDPINLASAATIGHGILKLDLEEISSYMQQYEESTKKVLKFVPASGAASRMFKSLFELIDSVDTASSDLGKKFFSELRNFAFYNTLKESFNSQTNEDFDDTVNAQSPKVLTHLLLEEGLSYGSLPKGLLEFHRYDSKTRTPVEEHIAEGLAYAAKNGEVHIHFTVSPAHQSRFEAHVNQVVSSMPSEKINVTYSAQKPSTDTVAADLNNHPFRDSDDNLLFRPAGHGALLENLNQLDADIIFIKNIDNVVPDKLKEETITYKKAHAGVLLNYQRKSFDLLDKADDGENIFHEGNKLLEEMGVKGDFTEEEVYEYLNRPIRVCGMVRNEGEPGGGPFWVASNDLESLQIVESAQVNKEDSDQRAIFESSTHFNPVDLVCSLKDHRNNKFDLVEYRDNETGFITEKSFEGRQLKAMELPGLWNGGMAFWNTIFVEVPLITFNPVKTIMDLLKDTHQ